MKKVKEFVRDNRDIIFVGGLTIASAAAFLYINKKHSTTNIIFDMLDAENGKHEVYVLIRNKSKHLEMVNEFEKILGKYNFKLD